MHLTTSNFERFLVIVKDEDVELSDDIIFTNSLLQISRIINTLKIHYTFCCLWGS